MQSQALKVPFWKFFKETEICPEMRILSLMPLPVKGGLVKKFAFFLNSLPFWGAGLRVRSPC